MGQRIRTFKIDFSLEWKENFGGAETYRLLKESLKSKLRTPVNIQEIVINCLTEFDKSSLKGLYELSGLLGADDYSQSIIFLSKQDAENSSFIRMYSTRECWYSHSKEFKELLKKIRHVIEKKYEGWNRLRILICQRIFKIKSIELSTIYLEKLQKKSFGTLFKSSLEIYLFILINPVVEYIKDRTIVNFNSLIIYFVVCTILIIIVTIIKLISGREKSYEYV